MRTTHVAISLFHFYLVSTYRGMKRVCFHIVRMDFAGYVAVCLQLYKAARRRQHNLQNALNNTVQQMLKYRISHYMLELGVFNCFHALDI
jgi:hypothetical protein